MYMPLCYWRGNECGISYVKHAGSNERKQPNERVIRKQNYTDDENNDDVDDNRVFPHEKFTMIKLYQYNNTVELTSHKDYFLPTTCLGCLVGGVAVCGKGARCMISVYFA